MGPSYLAGRGLWTLTGSVEIGHPMASLPGEEPMAFKKVVLCKLNEEYCPTVEQLSDGRVRIGEAPDFAYLTTDQWNMLVGDIESKKLTAI